MGRGRSSSWPPAAPALILLLLVVGFSHGAAAGRLLPLQPGAVVLHPENGVMAAADGLVLQKGEAQAAVNGADDLSGISEMMGAEEEAVECEGNDDECLQRRLLGDAHLDYIYTQHKGKP